MVGAGAFYVGLDASQIGIAKIICCRTGGRIFERKSHRARRNYPNANGIAGIKVRMHYFAPHMISAAVKRKN
jgi:hypothetical protein